MLKNVFIGTAENIIKNAIIDFLNFCNIKITEEELKTKVNFIIEKYNEPFRKYHNIFHVISLLQNESVLIKKSPLLNIAIVYHDIIYKIGNKYNELDSANVFLKEYTQIIPFNILKDVFELILATNKTPWDELSDLEKVLVDADWFDFTDINLAKYHNKLIKEEVLAAGFTEEEYNQGVYNFLNSICKKYYDKIDDIRLQNINTLLEKIKL